MDTTDSLTALRGEADSTLTGTVAARASVPAVGSVGTGSNSAGTMRMSRIGVAQVRQHAGRQRSNPSRES